MHLEVFVKLLSLKKSRDGFLSLPKMNKNQERESAIKGPSYLKMTVIPF